MSVPYWVQDAIFYQIFPDRFFRSQQNNQSIEFQAWSSPPTVRGFQGGNLRGIIEKFDYLLDLGVNALYLNPIFSSAANHRYHTNDYYKIDPTLGNMQDFHALLDVAHSNQVRVILDGVFNHSGRGFFAFADILDNGSESRYRDWYFINGFPLDAFGSGKATRYKAWWDIKDLPKLNTDNPAVREYLMGVSRYWIEQGADGWRLDVPAEIDDDRFWAEFRQEVRKVNSDAYLVGEIWDGDPRWVGENHFDGLMHYPLREAILNFLGQKDRLAEFVEKMEGFVTEYPRENVYAMYLALGSHDTRRLMSKLEDDLNRVKLAFLLQFANPGAPAIYYGDEIGMKGGKDPENRYAFPWDEKEWNHDLYNYVKKLIAARKRHPALRRGDLRRVYLSKENGWYAFARTLGEDQVIIALNSTSESHLINIPLQKLELPDGILMEDVITRGRYRVVDQSLQLTIGPWSGLMVGTILEEF
jgi:neopullulanase